MIGTRGEEPKVIVLEPHGIPIQDIADAITSDHDMKWLLSRFLVTEEEVFEVIDAAAGFLHTWENCITLKNLGDLENIDLEAEHVNSTMFFNILSYGRVQKKTSNFVELFRLGLVALIEDIYTDIGNDSEDFKQSDVHLALYDALLETIGDVNPLEVMEQLTLSEDQRNGDN